MKDPLAATGSESWQSASSLASGGDLRQMSKYDPVSSKFYQAVRVEHDDAFTLNPLVLTEGPLKGRRVLMLEPIRSFRLLDLPPEIRTIIYRYLVQKSRPIKIATLKMKGEHRRPVNHNFTCKTLPRHKNLVWDRAVGKWLGQAPSSFAVLKVNKQIFQEAAAVAYGDNVFEFVNTTDLNVFLRRIGKARKYIRQIRLPHGAPYTMGCGRTTFNSLLPAMDLRRLDISHLALCSNSGRRAGSVTLQNFVDDCTPYLTALHKSLQKKDVKLCVLDIIRVVVEDCDECKAGRPRNCEVQFRDCRMKCDDEHVQEHCRDVAGRLRALLAEELDIEE